MDDDDQITKDGSFEFYNSHANVASDSYSSFASGLTSSQRITRNGQVVVTNSDGESESDTSLYDIDELLMGTNRSIEASPSTEIPLPPLRSGARTRQRGREEALHQAKMEISADMAQRSKPQPASSKYKFSIGSLIAQVEKEDVAEAGALQARLAVGVMDEQKRARDARLVSVKKEEDMIQEGLFTSLIGYKNDNDGIDRLMQAIKRTEALYQDKTWLFFDVTFQDPQEPLRPFPSMPSRFLNILGSIYSQLRNIFRLIWSDPRDRQQAFLTGYVGDVAAKGRLPDEVLIWIFDNGKVFRAFWILQTNT